MVDEQAILTRITRITASLATVRDLNALAKAIHEVVEDIITVEYSGVYMMDFTVQKLRLWYAKGFTDDEHREAERTAWDRHPGWVLRNKEKLHVRDTDADQRTQSSKRAFHVRSRLWLPIMAHDEAVGALGLASSKLDVYLDEHIVILQYAATTTGFMFENLRDKWNLEQQFVVSEEQRLELVALSSPLVEVGDGIIVLPIIGRVDANRAQQITEKLLGIVASRSIHAVILDLTGVAIIDSASIEHLERMHRAVRLLGSSCLFSGISGQTAALITQIGGELGNWKTFATVRQALATFSNVSRKQTTGKSVP
jgi:rsbT co-antagonist protein RsbR